MKIIIYILLILTLLTSAIAVPNDEATNTLLWNYQEVPIRGMNIIDNQLLITFKGDGYFFTNQDKLEKAEEPITITGIAVAFNPQQLENAAVIPLDLQLGYQEEYTLGLSLEVACENTLDLFVKLNYVTNEAKSSIYSIYEDWNPDTRELTEEYRPYTVRCIPNPTTKGDNSHWKSDIEIKDIFINGDQLGIHLKNNRETKVDIHDMRLSEFASHAEKEYFTSIFEGWLELENRFTLKPGEEIILQGNAVRTLSANLFCTQGYMPVYITIEDATDFPRRTTIAKEQPYWATCGTFDFAEISEYVEPEQEPLPEINVEAQFIYVQDQTPVYWLEVTHDYKETLTLNGIDILGRGFSESLRDYVLTTELKAGTSTVLFSKDIERLYVDNCLIAPTVGLNLFMIDSQDTQFREQLRDIHVPCSPTDTPEGRVSEIKETIPVEQIVSESATNEQQTSDVQTITEDQEVSIDETQSSTENEQASIFEVIFKALFSIFT